MVRIAFCMNNVSQLVLISRYPGPSEGVSVASEQEPPSAEMVWILIFLITRKMA